MTNPVFAALAVASVNYRVIRYTAVRDAAEAAAARGVEVAGRWEDVTEPQPAG